MSSPDERRGKRLKAAREAKGLTQAAAAQRLGIDTQTLSRWERAGRVKPRDLVAAAQLYGVSIADLDPAQAKSLGDNRPAAVRENDPVSADEVSYIVDQVRQKATRYNIRRAQGAPPGELDRLYAELELSARNGLQAGANDEYSLAMLTKAMIGLLTSESDPPREEKPRGSAKQSGNTR